MQVRKRFARGHNPIAVIDRAAEEVGKRIDNPARLVPVVHQDVETIRMLLAQFLKTHVGAAKRFAVGRHYQHILVERFLESVN